MSKQMSQRIYTSLILLVILYLMFLNQFFLGFILIISSIFAIIEFNKMMKSIFKKFLLKLLISNLIFIFYIFHFSMIFLLLAFSLKLKIILFYIILICIFSDIGGILIGKYFKGRKLTKISPNKTISGSIGAILFSFIISLIVFIFKINFIPIYKLFIFSSLISISCQIGDIFFSYLKRKSKIKDTGNILPGHGGILDRVDGILLGLPVGFILINIVS